ncbi:MAG: iron ABC transporter permease [Armatimonadota bacterium]|nr:iron ABC transporter permease [Armatimonadota bacterium]MDR7444560.1 iron ABC transporter permease [Armatimonadota bacterium]MDR7570328.1 iron ABC transporter permease [Armatimonadota bacterium]MDR7615350.1 iron ABC transporter permease [Armatimonadota bacterium]
MVGAQVWRPEIPGVRASLRREGTAVLLLLGLGLLVVYPTAFLIYGSLYSAPPGDPGTLTAQGYRALGSGENLRILLETFGFALAGSGTGLVLGLLLGWVVARTDVPGAALWEALFTLPLFIPPVLMAAAWGMLAAPRAGLLNAAFRTLFGGEGPFNVYSAGGLVWYLVQYSAAFQLGVITGPLRAFDATLEDAGRVCGASRGRVFWSVVLPVMYPVVSNAFLYSFVRGFESFEGPLLLGLPAGIRMLATQIYEVIHQRHRPDYPLATAMGVVALLLTAPLVWVQWRLQRRGSFASITGRGYIPKPVRLRRWRWVAFGGCLLYALLVVGLPVGQLVLGSFLRFFGLYGANAWTLQHYQRVLRDPFVLGALRNTLLLGAVGATLAVLLGAAVAYVSVRGRTAGWVRAGVNLLSWLPLLMPGVVLGIAFLWAYAFLPRSISLYGTVWALLFAYVTLCLPVASRVNAGAFAQVSGELEECARVCGASGWRTFWSVVARLVWPSVAVGWILSFVLIVREVSASIMLAAPGAQVLSVSIVYLWGQGRLEEVCVVAVLMLVPVFLGRYLVGRLQRAELQHGSAG